jgi:shikimate kinase
LETDDPEARISELLKTREPLYQECAHLKLETNGLDSTELATGILECARYYYGQRRL